MWLCRTRVPPSGRSGTWALACPMLHDPKSPHHVGSNPHVRLRAQPGGPQATEGCFANLLPLRTVPSGSGLCLASLAASTWGLRGPRPTAPDFTAHLGAEWSESRERSGGVHLGGHSACRRGHVPCLPVSISCHPLLLSQNHLGSEAPET